MKKSLFIFSFLLVFTFAEGQNSKSLDTIYANNQKNVALFFPKPIRQGITGAVNFVFTYNREKGQYFGLLQASPGEESNLLAVTNDGQVYAYILKYKSGLSKLNYFINEKESIGNEKPQVKKVSLKRDLALANKRWVVKKEHAEHKMQQFAKNLLRQKFPIVKARRAFGIRLSLQKIVYHQSEVYMVLNIKNMSGIDFEIGDLRVSIVNGKNKRKSSYQKNTLTTTYQHGVPSSIASKKSEQLILVFPKFTLGESERLLLELDEEHGSRSVKVHVRKRMF